MNNDKLSLVLQRMGHEPCTAETLAKHLGPLWNVDRVVGWLKVARRLGLVVYVPRKVQVGDFVSHAGLWRKTENGKQETER